MAESMTKDDLEKLLTDKPAETKARGAVLFNAVGATMSSYNQDRSVANLRNMEAAKAAFDKFVAEIGGGKNAESFANIPAIVQYLDDGGFKVSIKTLYRHINKERKLLRQTDGTFSRKAVDTYAGIYLKQLATGKRIQQGLDELQREKLKQELKNLKLKNERDQFSFERDQGLYVTRAQMDIEVASFIAVLVSGFKNLITSRAGDWIALACGDHKKTGEVITQAIGDVDDLTNTIARASEYEVVIDGGDA